MKDHERTEQAFALLFPQPQEVVPANGVCVLPKALSVFDDFEDGRLAGQLGKAFPDKEVVAGDFLRMRRTPQAQGVEAYELEIRKDGITVFAANPVGAFYALKTLEQLARGGAPIPCGVVRDWPDMPFRGLHVMCGGYYSPDIETFRRSVTAMANLKLNKLVVEYDNFFPWVKHPETRSGAAYSLEGLRELVAYGRENFVEIIPLIDSLGHCGPYLGNATNFHLREDPDNPEELCPQSPESMKFIKELWTEVLAAHPESAYAHITGDEVFHAKPCPKCQPFDAAGRRGDLFRDYYTDLSRWVIEQGKIPVMWGDMFIKHPEALEGFPRDTIICDWDYSGPEGDLFAPYMENDLKGVCDASRRQLFAPYWQANRRGNFDPFHYLKFFGDQKFKTIACTSASPGGYWMTNLSPVTFYNNRRFAQEAARQRASCLGLLITNWGSNPVPGFWMGVVAGADFSWHARQEELGDFLHRFAAGFLRRPDWGSALIQLARTQEGQDTCVSELSGGPGPDAEPMAMEFVSLLGFTVEHMKLSFRESSIGVGGEAQPLDLGAIANCKLKDALPPKARRITTPPGEHNLHGLSFKLDADRVLSLSSEAPETVTLRLGCKLSGLVFWNLAYNAWPDKELATMIVHFADQSTEDFSFVGGVNVIDWTSHGRPKNGGSALVAWRGRKDTSESICSCLTLWRNPRPEMEVSSIELAAVTPNKQTCLVIMGMASLCGTVTWPNPNPIPAATIEGLETKVKALFHRWMNPSSVSVSADCALAQLKQDCCPVPP